MTRVLLVAAACAFLVAWSPIIRISGGGSTGTGVAFVTVAGSGLSAATQAQMPYASEEDGAPDYSSRPRVDVTSTSELTAAGYDPSCVLSNDGSTDNSADFACLLDDTDAADDCLEFPVAGSFKFASVGDFAWVYRPSNTSPGRCLVSDTPGTKATFRISQIHCEDAASDGTCDTGTLAGLPTVGDDGLGMFFGEDATYGSDLTWTDGGNRGDTTLTFSSVTGLADGDWLYLESTPTGQQPDLNVEYRVKVTGTPSTGAEGVTIDRPLPDDFNGTLTAREWTSTYSGWHLEDLDIGFDYPEHQGVFDELLSTRSMVESTIKNVTFDGYQYSLLIEDSARLRFERIFVSGNFDKPFNNYGITISGSHDITIVDSISDTPEAVACAGNSQNILIAFSYFPPPPTNAAYDTDCNGGNDCSWDDIYAHNTAHGPVDTCTDTSPADGECDLRTGETPTADGIYTHCSTNEDDLLGTVGSRSCHGTPTDLANGAVTLHNASCNNLAFVRNHVTGGIWHDFYDGPGRYNMFFGTLLNEHSSGDFSLVGDLDNGGDIGHKSLSNPGDVREDYALNEMVIGSSVRWLGGGAATSFDRMMEGARVEYNAIREGCEHSSNNSNMVSDCGAASVPGWEQGTHTGGDSTTVLTDSTYMVDPSVRDLVGALLWNRTDSESCVITGHTTTTLTCSGGLSGAGEWNSGDAWAVGGNNVSWTGNDVLTLPTDTPSIGITLPSAPGFDAFPSMGGTGTAPYVGADQGAVSGTGDSQNCLPAYERYHGTC